MKRFVLAIAAIAVGLLSFTSAVTAADLGDGAKVFSNNCASCHMGGNNVVNRAKTLKQGDLEKYDMASLDAIKHQVTNGKLAMPAFKGRLSDAQIENVAAYVVDQAEKGW
ncbi:MAG: cytochrome c6 PetJ [Elainellaceae cyanobacterium]